MNGSNRQNQAYERNSPPRPYPYDGDERWKYYQRTGLDPKTYWGEISPGLTHSEVHTAPPSYVRWNPGH
jgi:hypothetical protein